jgi:hypothetical protein
LLLLKLFAKHQIFLRLSPSLKNQSLIGSLHLNRSHLVLVEKSLNGDVDFKDQKLEQDQEQKNVPDVDLPDAELEAEVVSFVVPLRRNRPFSCYQCKMDWL